MTGWSNLERVRERMSAVVVRLTKIMMEGGFDVIEFGAVKEGVRRRTWRKVSRCVVGTSVYVCFRVAGSIVVGEDEAMSETIEVLVSAISEMKMGGLPGGRGACFRASTSGVIVAVKRRVSRSEEGGKLERHDERSGSMEP